MRKTIYYIFGLIIIACIFLLYSYEQKKSFVLRQPLPTTQVIYSCDNSKKINASFYAGTLIPVKPGEPPKPSGSVRLTLSDGRDLILQQTISADGGRYANKDESFVFWTKGNGSFIDEANVMTFANCVTDDKTNNK